MTLRAPHHEPGLPSETLYFKANDYFTALVSDLRKAQHSIDIEMYIWASDEVGAQFFQILRDAVLRGVRVRLLVDGIGSFRWVQTHLPRFRAAGIDVKVFRSLWWTWSVSKLSRFLRTLNRRNHRKIFLIDGQIAYTGSLNVHSSAFKWRESGLRLLGPSVGLIQEIFDDTWLWTGDPTSPYANPASYELQTRLLKSHEIRCNQFYQLRRRLKSDLIERIRGAKERIWVMTPYFLPSSTILNELMRAARRQVDVRVVLPFRSDIPFLRWIATLYYRFLLSARVKVYEYMPEVLHAKSMLIDDWGAIGSSNLNRRSSFHDLELDVVLRSPSALLQLEQQFLRDMEKSSLVTQENPLSEWKQFVARLLFRLRDWF